MRKLIILIVLAVTASTVQAIDLGDILKKVKPGEQPSSTTEQAPQKDEAASPADLAFDLFGEIPVEEEVRIGREVAGNLLGAAPLVKDEKLQRYVNTVGRWLSLQSERPELAWHFGVIESADINAFAAPGGYILVTKGLYRKLTSEAELAGVLAHEIGHIIRKHHLKLMQQGRMLDMGSRLLSQKAGSKDEAIKRLIGSGAEVFARSLDKNAEYEADRIAVVLATRAGYDSFGLPAVLQEIGHAGADDSRVGLLFKTHPHPDDRLSHLDDSMGSAFDRYKGKTVAERLYRLKQ
ncbi:MAG: M48 family metalloprotease [Nitrospirota bacterium]|nr:M48 family metalloprotease [Nitrospirota bacterium]